jgi:hypothetical protein
LDWLQSPFGRVWAPLVPLTIPDLEEKLKIEFIHEEEKTERKERKRDKQQGASRAQ